MFKKFIFLTLVLSIISGTNQILNFKNTNQQISENYQKPQINDCNEICQKIKILLKKNRERMMEIEEENSNLISEEFKKNSNSDFEEKNDDLKPVENRLEYLLNKNKELKNSSNEFIQYQNEHLNN